MKDESCPSLSRTVDDAFCCRSQVLESYPGTLWSHCQGDALVLLSSDPVRFGGRSRFSIVICATVIWPPDCNVTATAEHPKSFVVDEGKQTLDLKHASRDWATAVEHSAAHPQPAIVMTSRLMSSAMPGFP